MSKMKNMEMQNKISSVGKRFLATTAVLLSTLGSGTAMANKQCNEKTAKLLEYSETLPYTRAVAEGVARVANYLEGDVIKVDVVFCKNTNVKISVSGAGEYSKKVQKSVNQELKKFQPPEQDIKFSHTIRVR